MEETRRRLLRAAGRGFRMSGYGGLGVDAVAKEAGVTSGAFYAHFGSKADAFREALRLGLGELRDGILTLRSREGKRWLRTFATWYVSPQRRADLAGSCALPALTLEAARGDADARETYEQALREVVASAAAGLEGRNRETRALAILALLAGAMSMAHAVDDERLGTRIARAVTDAIAKLEPEG